MIWEIIKLNFIMFLNNLKFSTKEEKVRFVFISFIGIFFLIGAYIISYYAIIYIFSIPIIGTIFMLRLIALTMLTSFVMTIFSSLINSFSTIYGCEDKEFLISFPIKLNKIFFIKYISTYIKSTWMLLLLLTPFLIAFAYVKNITFVEFITVYLAMLLKMLISISIGVFISIILSYLIPSKKVKDVTVVLFILLVTISYSVFRFTEPEKLLNPDRFQEIVQYLDFMSKPVARWSPSWWLTEIIRGVVSKKYDLIYINFIKLFLFSTMSIFILLKTSKKLFYYGLFLNKGFKKRKKIIIDQKKIFNSQVKAVIMKDLKLLLREPVQWTQMVIIIALIIIYIFSISKVPINYQYVKVLVSFFNFGSIMFIISAMLLRFVFVQHSIEYRTLWILKSAPIKVYKIFCSKIFLFLPILLVLAWIVLLLSNIVLGLNFVMWLFGFFIITISVFVLTITGYCLGILLPKKEFNDIVQIETSFGGLMFIILSLGYIILILASSYYPVRQYSLGQTVLFKTIFFHSIGFFLINILYLGTMLYYGYRKFSLEF